MDIGIQIEPQFGYRYDDVVAIARSCETNGLSRVWLSDHLFLDPDSVATDCLEAWTLLAALARDTSRIRLGLMVGCQSYRNPALLAKIAAGVDRMSGGRLEFGVGAGWKELEYRAYGYEFPEPKIRVDELVDTLEICTRLWTQDKATYAGKRYRITDAPCAPKPVQAPLPIWIGGTKPRIMRTAARYATWFNFNLAGGRMTPEAIGEQMRALDDACVAVKRDPRSLKRSAFIGIFVAEDQNGVEALVTEAAAKAKLTPAEWRAARPGAVVGTPGAVAKRLGEYAAAGIEHCNALFPYGRELAMVELIGREVLPALD
ncbi:MAG TPA: LLM class flavin-dependent oxidoreductase [Candidatus Saccharimonadales bacterium]|nr:LLM class flavin-dependent oxidoreductase [Candidatus Saccharimonadales bacterium]